MSTIFIIVIIVINALPSSLSSSRTRSLLPTGPWVNEILPLAVSCSLLTKHLGSSSLYFTTVQTTECRYVLNAFYHLSSRIILIMPPAEFLPPPSRIIRRPTDHWPEPSRTLSRSPALYKKTKTTINTKTDTRTPSIVRGKKSLNLVWFKWGSQWWGILKHFAQSRCILISHWSWEK